MAFSTSSTKWTYDDYAAIPYDGRRHEIIDGGHFVNPAPNLYHQAISRRLLYQLYTAIELSELGFVINAPVDVQLGENDIVQPDIVVISAARRRIMTPIKVKGIPDLLIEIHSPSNPDHDRTRKRVLYEHYQVLEYWIVDPDEQQVLQLVLVDGKYQEQKFHQSIQMVIPPQTSIDLTQAW